jgi:uncharacterized membrane protein YeaQ/YmgE (transglycosylase-associated protein family)
MWILSWIVFGGVVGWVASIITGNNRNMGIIKNVLTGLVGSLIGGWISTLLGIGSVAGFNLNSFMMALVGAVLFLFLSNRMRGRRR